jgi:apolipoprotein D and lipocalin family protein
VKFVVIMLLLIVAGCKSSPIGNQNVPEPRQKVELKNYLGKWYEVARYDNWFEEDCESPQAEYQQIDAETIKIINSCIKNGAPDVAEGKAKIVENSNNAKLKVSFFGPFYLGDYWILEHAEDYSWSIVGEPTGRYLWILTRMQKPEAKLMQELLARVQNLGYDSSLLIFPETN